LLVDKITASSTDSFEQFYGRAEKRFTQNYSEHWKEATKGPDRVSSVSSSKSSRDSLPLHKLIESTVLRIISRTEAMIMNLQARGVKVIQFEIMKRDEDMR